MAAKKKPSAAPVAKPADAAVSQARIAALLGCNSRTVREYLSRGIIPESARAPGGKLFEVAAVSSVAFYQREQLAGRAAASDDLDPVRANVELKQIQARVAGEEFRIKQAKACLIEGETIRREAVTLACSAVVSALRSGLESLPVEVNAIVGGIDSLQAEAIRDAVHQKLDDCAADMASAVRRTVLDTALSEDDDQ